MFLGIKTDAPVVELYLIDSTGNVVEKATWDAGRTLAHLLLSELATFVGKHGLALSDIAGFFVYSGPGSYTGLRIGLTVMNTLAYAQNVPIVGAQGDAWVPDAVARLSAGETDRVVLPIYGGDAHITAPKK